MDRSPYDPLSHSPNCEYQFEQVPAECTCDVLVNPKRDVFLRAMSDWTPEERVAVSRLYGVPVESLKPA